MSLVQEWLLVGARSHNMASKNARGKLVFSRMWFVTEAHATALHRKEPGKKRFVEGAYVCG